MRKRFACLLSGALALCLTLAACGGQGETAAQDPDPAGTAQALLDAGVFADALDTVDLEAACQLYGIDAAAVEEGVVYASLTAGAEEIAVLRMADADAAAGAVTALEGRVADQKAALKDYQPDEVTKLDGAIVTRMGNTALLVVANDAAGAQSVLDGLGK